MTLIFMRFLEGFSLERSANTCVKDFFYLILQRWVQFSLATLWGDRWYRACTSRRLAKATWSMRTSCCPDRRTFLPMQPIRAGKSEKRLRPHNPQGCELAGGAQGYVGGAELANLVSAKSSSRAQEGASASSGALNRAEAELRRPKVGSTRVRNNA